MSFFGLESDQCLLVVGLEVEVPHCGLVADLGCLQDLFQWF